MAALDFRPCTPFTIDGAPVFLHRGLSRRYRRLNQEFKMAAMAFICYVFWTVYHCRSDYSGTVGVLDTLNSP